MHWPSSILSRLDTNGSATAIIATDKNGDIGITSENCELTVFGLGGHAHYSSSTNDLDETRNLLPEITSFIDDLIHCRKALFGVYSNGIDPYCGGFGIWKNENLYIHYTPKINDRIVVRVHGEVEKTIPKSQVFFGKSG